MRTLIYIKNFIIVFGELLFTEPKFGWAVFMFAQTLLTGVLGVYFIFKLNPIFEPFMKDALWMVNLAPNLSTRYLRAGQYAFFVVFPNFNKKQFPRLTTFDWQTRISARLHGWCCLFVINGLIFFTVNPIMVFLVFPNMK
jgi:hypothetical protein